MAHLACEKPEQVSRRERAGGPANAVGRGDQKARGRRTAQARENGALQESFINYGGNSKPEWLTCLHEEASVGMCHGYAKASGKPMAAMVH
ncbi:MAG TPA: hypothetical protein VL966_06165, partial [Alphaproteobacteria bacterium]|nr:hypothetical protein [Alphaproteobacteria bacterium]